MCKLVSIQLIDHDCSDAACGIASSHLCSHGAQRTSDGRTWYPKIPAQADFIQLIPTNTKVHNFNLHLNMNIAGQSGHRLSSLRRIVALIGGHRGLFLGLRFVYDNGESNIFRRKRNATCFDRDSINTVESSFYIDGAGGERVSAVRIGSHPSHFGIECLEVWIRHFASMS